MNPLLEGDFLLRWTITLTYLVSLLTNFNTMIFSVVRFPAPAAEKKQKQGLNMTAEIKAQQDEVAKHKITRLPASPAAEKKQNQHIKMTAEKKEGSAGHGRLKA
jgi:hypothetical protein